MLTTMQQYHDYLVSLQKNDGLTPSLAALKFNPAEKIYDIDLNKRIIEAPEFLSVKTDHRAEIVYFKFDRFFDNMDLTNTTCIIEYYNKNAQKDKALKEKGVESGIYVFKVPCYDIQTCAAEDKVVIPWLIEGPATVVDGDVVFAIRFYIANSDGYSFILNTQPATSKVLYGMDNILRSDLSYDLGATLYEQLLHKLTEHDILWEQNLKEAKIHWIDV